MALKLKLSVVLIAFSILFYSCEKEFSLEGNILSGTAVFTLTGAPSTCINATIAGSYQAGVTLDAANTVTIAVDVTTAGTYSIATTNVNGLTFSGSGTFAATGPQTITLVGTGTPLAAGSFSYTPGSNGCSFSITVAGGGGGGGGTAVYTFSGAPNTCTSVTPAGVYTAGVALTSTNTVTLDVTVTTIGTYTVSTPVINGFSFSGSGTFSVTGPQSITLLASGTPVQDGIIDFTLPNSCTFPITVDPAVNPDFITCKIDGVDRSFNIDISGTSPDPAVFIFGGDETLAATTPYFSIYLSQPGGITVGTYNKISATNNLVYCAVQYNDGVTVNPWAVGLSPLQPAAFTVTVVSITSTTVTGTFSGTLYSDTGLGNNTKVFTDGSFSITF